MHDCLMARDHQWTVPIVVQTKGRFQPRPEDIFAAAGEKASLPTPLWPYLTALALILYLTDVFTPPRSLV